MASVYEMMFGAPRKAFRRVTGSIRDCFRRAPSWKKIEYFDESWKGRIRAMATLIEDEKSVLDLGCGKMWLRDMLPEAIRYVGCDYANRGGNLICDFNRHEFPDVQADVAFVSGCLEYLHNPNWFLAQVRAHCQGLVLSFCTLERMPDMNLRHDLGWTNHYSSLDLQKLVSANGFRLQRTITPYYHNEIHKFVRTDLHLAES
jgi:hypothetical protein